MYDLIIVRRVCFLIPIGISNLLSIYMESYESNNPFGKYIIRKNKAGIHAFNKIMAEISSDGRIIHASWPSYEFNYDTYIRHYKLILAFDLKQYIITDSINQPIRYYYILR